jgi:phosphatidylglycerol---prolipoprotein diacylglyceryl transferase
MSLFAIPFPMIDPVLFEAGPFVIRWYSLAYIVGLIGGWLYTRRLLGRESLWSPCQARPMPEHLDDLLLWAAIGVIAGGRLGHVLFYEPAAYLANPLDILKVWQGGMSFHGGLIGCIVAIVLFAGRKGLPVLTLFDLAACAAPIGLGLGRVANFINAELWGRVSDVPWAILFPRAGPQPRHPSQLYEAFAEGLLLFIILMLLVRSGALRRPGLVAGGFGIGYALARMVCEIFREPDAHIGFLAFGTTWGQWLSLPVLLAGLWLVLRTRSKPGIAHP